jgi:hypothetical protein
VRDKRKFRINLRSKLGVIDHNYWIKSLDISNVMSLQPMTADELISTEKSVLEISKDTLLENLVLYVVSAFCAGTELRFRA